MKLLVNRYIEIAFVRIFTNLDSYELDNNSFLLCATFLGPNYKSFQFFEKYEKKKYLKSVKEFLSDFYLAKRVSEMIPIKKETNESKKLKLSFDDEEDDSGSDSDKNLSLDLRKEISEYIKLSVHKQNVFEFWHQNQHVFQILYCILKMILCTPTASAPSEHLFSDALNDLYAKRKRMTAECFQMLTFSLENLEFLNLV